MGAFSFGIASTYEINEKLTIGSKFIFFGAEGYLDFDQQPFISNADMLFFMGQYGRFYLSAGYGGIFGYSKFKDYNKFETEFRYSLSNDQEESYYIGISSANMWKTQKTDEVNGISTIKISTSAINFIVGKYW